MQSSGEVGPSGDLSLKVIRAPRPQEDKDSLTPPPRALSLPEILHYGAPQAGVHSEYLNRWKRANLGFLWRGLRKVLVARSLGIPHFYGSLSLKLFRADGRVINYGLVSMRVVTNAGAGFIVDGFQNLVELENMKFHGVGTGSTAEAATETALVTEWAGADYTGGVRATGSTTENGAQVYRTVGTNTKASAGDSILREHGVLSSATVGGGVLLDRTLFAAITLSQNDALQATYDFTVNSGS